MQLPLLRPVIFLALVLRFLEAMAEFPKTWALLQGGPGTATETLPIYIFLTTWQYFEISKGAAMSYIVMLLMIVIVLIAIRLLRREKRALDAMYARSGRPVEMAVRVARRSRCGPMEYQRVERTRASAVRARRTRRHDQIPAPPRHSIATRLSVGR